MDASNRSRIVTDIMYDDFMQWERPLGVERVPSRLAATRGASPSSQVPEHGHPAARLEPSHEVAKSYGKIPKSQNLLLKNIKIELVSRCSMAIQATRGGAARRAAGAGTGSTSQGLSNCIKSSHRTSVTTLGRLEASTTVLVVSKIFGSLFLPQCAHRLQNRSTLA